jgi:hypothetical protein
MRRASAVTAACLCVGAVVLLVAPAAGAQPVQMPALSVAAGLSSATLGGMSVARDGSGGLVYTAETGGVTHAYVSRLVDGAFEAPQQLDIGLDGSSSQAVIAAGNGGVLAVAFVNGGSVYTTQALSSTAQFSAPQQMQASAYDPQIALNTYGVGYLAFTASDGAGDNVDVEYWNGSGWAPASPEAVNMTSGDDAGTGAGAPSVAAAGDGVGVVAWGENGHVYSRRVWGTATSVETELLDPASFNGWSEVTADSPAVSVGGDSSYIDVAFREQLQSGSSTQERVLLRQIVAEDVGPVSAADGQSTGGPEGATDPQIAMNEYGRGFVTARADNSNEVFETTLGTNGAPGGTARVDGTAEITPTYPVPGLAGLSSTLVAWQQTGAGLTPQIAWRFGMGGTALGTTMIASSTLMGPTDAADGLDDAGDVNGDAAVAWVQGAAGDQSIVTDELLESPGQASPVTTPSYANTSQPTLTWNAARESWGPITYTVFLDGHAIAQTTATSLTVPSPLIDGPHVWQVTATNETGQTSTSPKGTVFVDTYPPRLRLRLAGRTRTKLDLTLRVTATDPPNPAQPGAGASGIAKVTVRWGDGTKALSATKSVSATHSYRRTGLYRVIVTATDKAGNTTTVSRYLRILP